MNKKQKIRETFRTESLKRDKNSCIICKAKNVELDVHHITNRNDIPNGGYVKENGASLCEDCHIQAEDYLNGNLKVDKKYHPDNLYLLINSNKELAFKMSVSKLN